MGTKIFTDADRNPIRTGFYHCFGKEVDGVRSHRGPKGEPKPELDFAFVFTRTGDSISYDKSCFPPTNCCMSIESLAHTSIPLTQGLISSLEERHGDGIYAWLFRLGKKYEETHPGLGKRASRAEKPIKTD